MKQEIFFIIYSLSAIVLKSHFHSTAGMSSSDMLHAEPMYDIYDIRPGARDLTRKVINLNLQMTAVLGYNIRYANLPIKMC